jgi:hypothetical protein
MPAGVDQTAFRGPSPTEQTAPSAFTFSLPTTAELVAIFNVSTNGWAMLSAAGGLAMAVLGVRTLVGGRRPAAARREREMNDD